MNENLKRFVSGINLAENHVSLCTSDSVIVKDDLYRRAMRLSSVPVMTAATSEDLGSFFLRRCSYIRLLCA